MNNRKIGRNLKVLTTEKKLPQETNAEIISIFIEILLGKCEIKLTFTRNIEINK